MKYDWITKVRRKDALKVTADIRNSNNLYAATKMKIILKAPWGKYFKIFTAPLKAKLNLIFMMEMIVMPSFYLFIFNNG